MVWKSWEKDGVILSVRPALVRFRGFGLHPGESGHDVPAEEFEDALALHEVVARNMGKRILQELLTHLGDGEASSWHNGGHSVSIQPVEICIGQDSARGGDGTSWTVEDFIMKHRATVENTFGSSIIEEIMGELRARRAL